MPSRQYWETYLSKARNGHDRPIDGSASKRVIRGHDGDIILRLHNTDVVTLHADGTETIRTGGWQTVTTSRFLSEHSAARVWSVKGQWTVKIGNPTVTPARVWKDRTCRGTGMLPQSCHGPSWCYSGSAGYTYAWGSRADVPCEHGQTDSHRLPECSHGQAAGHPLESVQCWHCHGTGRYDYGSQEVHYAWDGDPLTIGADGYAVGPATVKPHVAAGLPKHTHGNGHGGWSPACDCPEPYSASQYNTASYSAPVPASSSYSDSGRMLAAALPGLATRVPCPVCDDYHAPVQTAVIHMNDVHRWTREAIADWLDSLDVDLSFPVPDHIPAHIH